VNVTLAQCTSSGTLRPWAWFCLAPHSLPISGFSRPPFDGNGISAAAKVASIDAFYYQTGFASSQTHHLPQSICLI
jgi:hypothetical protein